MALMESFKLPDGTKNYFPEKLAYQTRKGEHVVFHTLGKDGLAYLVHLLPKGMEVLTKGRPSDVIEKYESLQLEESQVIDSNGVFFFKLATDIEQLKAALES